MGGTPCWYTMDSHLVKVGSGDVWSQHWSSWFFLSQIQDEQTNNDNSTWVFLPGSQGVTWKVVEFLEFFLCVVRSPWNLRLHMCWYVFWGRSVCHHALQTFGQNLCQVFPFSFFFLGRYYVSFARTNCPSTSGSRDGCITWCNITGLHPTRCYLFVNFREIQVDECTQVTNLYVDYLCYYTNTESSLHTPTSCLNI